MVISHSIAESMEKVMRSIREITNIAGSSDPSDSQVATSGIATSGNIILNDADYRQFTKAVESKNFDALKSLIDRFGPAVAVRKHSHAIRWCVFAKWHKAIKYILDTAKAMQLDVTSLTQIDGIPLLSYAILMRSHKTVHLLLEYGANIYQRQNQEVSASTMDFARRINNQEAIKSLIENGFDPSVPGNINKKLCKYNNDPIAKRNVKLADEYMWKALVEYKKRTQREAA